MLPTVTEREEQIARRRRYDDDRHALARSQIFYNYAYPLTTLAVGVLSVLPVLIIVNRGGLARVNVQRHDRAIRRADHDAFKRTAPADVVAEAEAHMRRAAKRGEAIRPDQVRKPKGWYL